jgi:hypothetical protein
MIEFASKWQFHVLLFSIHLVSAVYQFLEAGDIPAASVNITQSGLITIEDDLPTVNEFVVLNVVTLTAVFLLFTAFAHMLFALIVYRTKEPLRPVYHFIEYTITAPLMLVIIAVAFGARDFDTLAALYALCISVMLFGLLQELTDAEASYGYMPTLLGWIPYCFLWGIVIGFYVRLQRAEEDIPEFVTAVLAVEIFLFTLFGFVQFYGVFMSSSSETFLSDPYYNILSVASKMLLAWLIFTGFRSMD